MPQQCGDGVIFHVAERSNSVAGGSTAASTVELLHPPSPLADEKELEVGIRSGEHVERRDQIPNTLSRLERAECHDRPSPARDAQSIED